MSTHHRGGVPTSTYCVLKPEDEKIVLDNLNTKLVDVTGNVGSALVSMCHRLAQGYNLLVGGDVARLDLGPTTHRHDIVTRQCNFGGVDLNSVGARPAQIAKTNSLGMKYDFIYGVLALYQEKAGVYYAVTNKTGLFFSARGETVISISTERPVSEATLLVPVVEILAREQSQMIGNIISRSYMDAHLAFNSSILRLIRCRKCIFDVASCLYPVHFAHAPYVEGADHGELWADALLSFLRDNCRPQPREKTLFLAESAPFEPQYVNQDAVVGYILDTCPEEMHENYYALVAKMTSGTLDMTPQQLMNQFNADLVTYNETRAHPRSDSPLINTSDTAPAPEVFSRMSESKRHDLMVKLAEAYIVTRKLPDIFKYEGGQDYLHEIIKTVLSPERVKQLMIDFPPEKPQEPKTRGPFRTVCEGPYCYLFDVSTNEPVKGSSWLAAPPYSSVSWEPRSVARKRRIALDDEEESSSEEDLSGSSYKGPINRGPGRGGHRRNQSISRMFKALDIAADPRSESP